MKFQLPKTAYLNKFIAKSKFYEKANINYKLQKEFVEKIQRITWLYKLSEETIGITKTKNVTEIQIFEIALKQFLNIDKDLELSFEDSIIFDSRIRRLESEINILENKIRKEKQFKYKVEFNRVLLDKKNEFKGLVNKGVK